MKSLVFRCAWWMITSSHCRLWTKRPHWASYTTTVIILSNPSYTYGIDGSSASPWVSGRQTKKPQHDDNKWKDVFQQNVNEKITTVTLLLINGYFDAFFLNWLRNCSLLQYMKVKVKISLLFGIIIDRFVSSMFGFLICSFFFNNWVLLKNILFGFINF